MIGKINCQPSFIFSHVKSDNNACLEKKPLKNKITGSTINVKNIDADFRIVSKELSLFREIKNNPRLACIANIDAQKNQSARFWSIGMAVSAISNSDLDGNRFFVDRKVKEKADEICDKNALNNPNDIKSDLSVNKRGQEYIHSFLNAETPLDSTNYAIGLSAASEVIEGSPYLTMRKQFGFIWEQRQRLILSGK
ncbi:hypothetical protein [Pectobacterium versatile]|uniref:hypothetical protein n=1 Tax=Pectobacterium versatile TaxID=2488639 RepID=UPI001CCA2ECF|nr:hypothetical protein [Pectobacterium versatile]